MVLLRVMGWSYGDIGKEMQLSKPRVFRAYKDVQANGGECGRKSEPRSRQTIRRQDRILHRLSMKDRFKTAVDIHRELTSTGTVGFSIRSIPNR
ncbi:unnamed protein product [Nippostrongylus brasiliensis]|uniref:Sigma70_r4_2 domain-containing protein n=1 Tax=Nippostrongylus brasiliensis TaxID=27835 RepID=A0A0N4YCZ2_NIPBR|nr:unnamed protein product [Nippostrongylus brasiliensis]